MPNSVKYFSSDMSGAPELSGTAGTLIAVLDACLVNGFGAVTINSLSVSSGIATATVSTGHGFAMVGNTGPVIQISGATPAGLNVEWRVASVESATVFTFACPGVADGTASGTITAKRAPASWEKRYSGTNKAAYARLDLAATAMLLRVDDAPAQYPTLIMYEAMSDVDTGAGPAPTSGSLYAAKSSTANSTAREWVLFADSCGFFLFTDTNSLYWYSAFFFGDIISFASPDAYCAALIAHAAATYNTGIYKLGSTEGSLLSRSSAQVGGAVSHNRRSSSVSASICGSGGAAYPNAAGNGALFASIDVWEGSAVSICRGVLSGLFNVLHPPGAIGNGVILDVGAKNLMVRRITNNNYQVAIDITGPWR